MRRSFFAGGLAVAAALLLNGGHVRSTDEPAPVVLGALYNLSGSQAELDIPSSRGARLAIDQANRNGGVLGRNVQLVLEDGQSQTAIVARKTADILKRHPNVSGFMGLSDTDLVLAAAPVAAKDGRLFLTSGATSPLLPAQVPEYLFLACFGDNVQAAAAVEFAYHDLKARTVSVLFNASMTYTRLLHGYFQTRFRQLGGQVLTVESYEPVRLKDVIGRVAKADVIFVAAESGDAVTATLLLRKAGITAPILGGDGFDLENAWQKHLNVGDVYFTTHAYLGADNPDPKVIAFRKAYSDAYPGREPDAFSALGYDAAQLLMVAVTNANSAEPAKLLEALAGIRKFDGVTGTLSYPAGSRIPSKSVSIVRIESGKRSLVRQFVPTKVPPP